MQYPFTSAVMVCTGKVAYEAMIKINVFSALVVALILNLARAQTESYSVTSCIAGSPITAVPACDPFLQGKPLCPGVTNSVGQKSCLCKQEVINSIRE